LNHGVEGPFGWIKEGSVDIVADILFPEDKDGLAYWVSFLARVSRLVWFFDFTV